MPTTKARTSAAIPPRVPRRRWFRFSLRSFLLLVAVLCALSAYVGRELHSVRARQAMITTILENHGVVLPPGRIIPYDGPGIPWVRRLLGDEPIGQIFVQQSLVADVRALFPEAEVTRQWPRIYE